MDELKQKRMEKEKISGETKQVRIPQPPSSPNNQVYYLVYGEWVELVQEPSVATPEHPNPQGRVLQRTVGSNEVIAMHPVVYWIACQSNRYAYKIKYAVSLSKELYQWYKQVEKIMNEAQQEAENGTEGISPIITS